MNNKNSINIEYEKFIHFTEFYFGKIQKSSDKLNYYLKNILIAFIEKNPEKFIDITKFINKHYIIKRITYIIYDILINIIKKDL